MHPQMRKAVLCDRFQHDKHGADEQMYLHVDTRAIPVILYLPRPIPHVATSKQQCTLLYPCLCNFTPHPNSIKMNHTPTLLPAMCTQDGPHHCFAKLRNNTAAHSST